MRRVWMILAGLSPLCVLAGMVATPAAKQPIQSTPGGRAVMVTGGPVIELEAYTPTPPALARWCVVDTGGSVLMVRSSPELDPKGFTNRLGTVEDGERLKILGMARTQGKTRTWYHVKIDNQEDEFEGWVAAMYRRVEVESE